MVPEKAEIRDLGIRTFELIQYLTGYIEGVEKMEDLPPQVQDTVMAALEKKAEDVQLNLKIVSVRCDRDDDRPDDHPHKFFLHIIASEIVAVIRPMKDETRH